MARSIAPRGVKRSVAIAVLLAWVTTGLWQTHKPMPPGTHVQSISTRIPIDELRFLTDLTYLDAQGQRHSEQAIFDAVFKLIDAAHSFIVADFFLCNDSMGAASAHRALSAELAEHLLARKAARPELRIVLITDPVNEIYGGTQSSTLERLRRGGIDIVTTDLNRLRDSNPAYSAPWRMFVQWFGNTPDSGFMPNPFGGTPERITLRSWLDMLNFKANHRKLIATDRADGSVHALVTSANPHDASSAHSNVALQLSGPLAAQIAANELEVARFSGWRGEWSVSTPPASTVPAIPAQDANVTFVTEAAIHAQLLRALATTQAGDKVRLAMFYLSERDVVEALLAAAARGVRVQLILDPNKDAFGRRKDGVPNRPVAHELVDASAGRIEVRWYQTSGEQFHTKMTLITRAARLQASLGSANLTRRNLKDYNLEANVMIDVSTDSNLAREMTAHFERLWNNRGGEYTLPFAHFEDSSRARYWRYRFMEATGLSTF